MGIDGYTKFMLSTFPTCFTKVPKHSQIPRRVDRLYVDCNELLHKSARKARNEDELFGRLMGELDALMEMTRPRVSVLLALDGPGPYAKVSRAHRAFQSFISPSCHDPGNNRLGVRAAASSC